ncbi:unnamed protein product [Caenorhabditis auriculariae]|uniref:UBX domain-containing protein n=1 Tax=Caenorhabditis auriculariae TaxID=2777116 RepID=A0A8S1GZI2_9PELO|nr:unnamed protein product [Caenorhabditis auriculariae]
MDMDNDASISEIMSITDCSQDEAMHFLELADFDVELAIQYFYDTPERDAEIVPEDSIRHRRPPQPVPPFGDPPATPIRGILRLSGQNNRQPQVVRYQSWDDWFGTIIRMPFFLISVIIRLLWRSLGQAATHLDHNKYKSFIEYLDDKHPQYSQSPNKSQWVRGTFTENARNLSRNEPDKRLLVYLHDPENSKILDGIMTSRKFYDAVRENNCVLYATLINSNEANKIRKILKKKKPVECLVVLCFQSADIKEMAYAESPTNIDYYVDNMGLEFEDFNVFLARRAAEREAIEADRNLVQMQNREYQESLQRDLRRIAEERKKKEAEELEAKMKEEKLSAAAKRRELIANYRQEAKAKTNASTGDVRLLLKFPNGSRQEVRFSATDDLSHLFDAAISNDACPEFFALKSTFPARTIFCSPDWYNKILEEEEVETESNTSVRNETFQSFKLESNSIIFVSNLV